MYMTVVEPKAQCAGWGGGGGYGKDFLLPWVVGSDL